MLTCTFVLKPQSAADSHTRGISYGAEISHSAYMYLHFKFLPATRPYLQVVKKYVGGGTISQDTCIYVNLNVNHMSQALFVAYITGAFRGLKRHPKFNGTSHCHKQIDCGSFLLIFERDWAGSKEQKRLKKASLVLHLLPRPVVCCAVFKDMGWGDHLLCMQKIPGSIPDNSS